MPEPASYLGEVMVHKTSKRIGPIVRVAKPVGCLAIELTLNTHDGSSITGEPSDFELATKEEYHRFVESWLALVPVGMY